MLLSLLLSDCFNLLLQVVCAVCKNLSLHWEVCLLASACALQSGQRILLRTAGPVSSGFWRQAWLSSLLLVMNSLQLWISSSAFFLMSSCPFTVPRYVCRGLKKWILGATHLYSCIADVPLSTELQAWAQNCRNKFRSLFYASDFLFSFQHETLLKALMRRQNEGLNRNSCNLSCGGTSRLWN